MNHPWKEIPLSDYEQHMALDSVGQLQALNRIMKGQFEDLPVHSAMVLGIAGGNGMEHVPEGKFDTVWGIDINRQYLAAAEQRYPALQGILRCLCLDLANEAEKLPRAELVIANLLVEYIGYSAFRKVIRQVNPVYVSCVIQINADDAEWVSGSPYLHSFDRLDEVHHQMEEKALTEAMDSAGYEKILRKSEHLPNGKMFIRLDYRKRA